MSRSLQSLPKGNASEAKYRQISDHLRSLIEHGELKPGTRLPSIAALAKKWDTNYFTVHSALTPLVNEGLLERSPRRGTFVRENNAQMNTVAIYYGADLWADTEGIFFQQAYRELQSVFEKHNIKVQPFIANLSKKGFTPLPELIKAIERREIQGLVGLLLNQEDIDWLHDLEIPTSLMYPRDNYGLEESIRLALTRLSKDGCKTVGMIFRYTDGLYPLFKKVADSLKLKTRESWVRQDETPELPRGEDVGYHAFKEIWSQSERPQGLFIHPDWVCRGAITAIQEMGVQVPKQLRLVLYRNAGLDYACPWKVPALVSDVRKIAADLFQHLMRQYETGKLDTKRTPLHPELKG